MKHQSVQVRSAQRSDSAALAQLFYDTVHSMNCQDYSQSQLEAWAPSLKDPLCWWPQYKSQWTFVAELNAKIVGFCELDLDGHIGCFYCHYQHQRQGVGSALFRTIERIALDNSLTELEAEVSITARPFFEHRDFYVVRSQQVERNGVPLCNFFMKKPTIAR